MSAFSDVLIPNPHYVLLGESYHGQILVGLEYTFLTRFLLSELQTLMLLKFPTIGLLRQHSFI